LTVPKVDQGRMEIAFVFNDQHGVVNLVAGQRADEIAADMALVIKDLAKDLALVIKDLAKDLALVIKDLAKDLALVIKEVK